MISRHIKNVFEEGELARDSVVACFATTAADGKTYQVEYFNLDMIISVGYRVKPEWCRVPSSGWRIKQEEQMEDAAA